jgi:hypothetical protein
MPDRPSRRGEFELIARYFAPLAAAAPGALGLTDDAAWIRPAPGEELVVTTDALVEGVHFLGTDPPSLIARKALRVNLSDLAAKGAQPLAYLLDTVFSRGVSEEWIAAFAEGLAADQAEYGVALIGGDTTATPGPTMLAITALGTVPAGRMIRRSTAKPGDDVYVSGSIGDAALGLEVLRGGLADLPEAARAHLIGRYRLPQPRLGLGPRLWGLAHAAIDVSVLVVNHNGGPPPSTSPMGWWPISVISARRQVSVPRSRRGWCRCRPPPKPLWCGSHRSWPKSSAGAMTMRSFSRHRRRRRPPWPTLPERRSWRSPGSAA